MTKAKLSQTKGHKVQVDFGSKKATFTAGGKKRVLVDEYYHNCGAVYVNGEIKDKNGNRFYAILELDESSSGEYYGGLYFVNTPQGVQVKEILGNVGPHSYKYHARINAHDHHVGDDGWSVC